MSDIEKVKSKRDAYLERLRAKYPDKKFEDDEEIFGQISDDFDQNDQALKDYAGREQAFSEMFASDPRAASMFVSWRNGGNPVIELVRLFGSDFVEEMQDPEKQEELAKASKEFAERVAKEREFEEQHQKNTEETLATLEQLQAEEGWSDEDIDAAMDFLSRIMTDGILGKFSRESILMARQALNHDADVEAAAMEGEVKGRNSKIEEKLRKSARHDGTASLSGRNSGGGGGMEAPEMGAINRNYGSASIFERGGEKRIKR